MLEVLGRIGFGLFGLAVLIGIVWLFSNNRRAIDWKLVATGITLQIAFAALVLLVPGGREVFDWLGHGFYFWGIRNMNCIKGFFIRRAEVTNGFSHFQVKTNAFSKKADAVAEEE